MVTSVVVIILKIREKILIIDEENSQRTVNSAVIERKQRNEKGEMDYQQKGSHTMECKLLNKH